MKKLLFVLIVILMLPIALFSQDTWDRMVRPLTWFHHMFEVYEIKECYDGGYAMIGSCQWYLDEVDMHPRTYIMKTDSEGILQWSIQDSIDATGNNNHFSHIGFVETPDHGFIVATHRSLFKYDEFGNRCWSHNEDSETGFDMTDITMTNDGNILLSGRINYVASCRKITQDNEIIWEKTYPVPDNQYSIVRTSFYTESNNLIQVVAAQPDFFEDGFILIYKCDSLGDTLLVNRDIPDEYFRCFGNIYEDIDTSNLYFTNGNATLIANSDCEIISYNFPTIDATKLEYHSPSTLITRGIYYHVLDKNSLVEIYSSEETGTELGHIDGYETFIILDDGFMVTAGDFTYSDGIRIIKTNSLGAVPSCDYTIPEPNQMILSNYPNPFNPETTLSFELKADSDATLEVFNIKGQKVNTLVERRLSKGSHTVVWSGEDKKGNTVTSGIYFYKLTAGNESVTKKAVLMK